MPNVLKFFALLGGTLALLVTLYFKGIFDGAQIASVTIFSMFIYGTLLFGDFRLAFAFGGIAILLGSGLLSVDQFVLSANLRVIIFLVGMFLVIGYLEENQFFEQVVSWIVGRVGPRPKALLLTLMIMGTVSAALVDEVTSILFMTGTMLHLTGKYKLNPIPFIIMLVFATNIGSAASSIGNPIGVMIAFNAHFTFVEFLRWSAPIAIVVNIVTFYICRWWFADSFAAFAAAVEQEHEMNLAARKARQPALATVGGDGETIAADASEPEANPLSDAFFDSQGGFEEGTDAKARAISWTVFLVTILLLITHGQTEHLLGWIFGHHDEKGQFVYAPLPEGTMMLGASLLMGSVVLLLRGNRARELVERRVDWWTLSFFMMLFASVGTLEETRVTRVIADRLIHGVGSNPAVLIQIIGWATGWLSAFLDNVLAVATFMPVVKDVRMAAPGPYPEAVYWLMLFGGTFMGNMTIIGSTANIIAVGVLEKRGLGSIGFGYWFKIGFLVSIASMLVATLLLGAQTGWFAYPLLPKP